MMRARGFTLIEVLVAIALLALSVLGIGGLQSRAQQAELESYQRSQALILAEDIVQRLNANRKAAGCYEVTAGKDGAAYVGIGNDPASRLGTGGCGTNAERALADDDLTQWDALLEGQTEILAGSAAGTLAGARGCITYDAANNRYTVAIAWQGEAATAAPGNTCASGLYGDEALRRVVTVDVWLADLS